MDEKQMREAAARIEAWWQMGGLTGGLYEDFAVEVAKLAVAAERERCATIARNKAWHCEEHENQYGKTAALDIDDAIRGMGPNVVLSGARTGLDGA